MKLTKQMRRWYATYALIFGYIAFVLITIFLLFFGLGKPQGLSPDELNAVNSAHSLSAIIENPINAPFKLPHLILHIFNVNDLYRLRAISAVFGLITITLFYIVIRSIFSVKTASLSTMLAVSSSWLLQYSRVAVPDILLAMGLLIIPSIGLWLQRAKHSNWVFLIGIILFGLFLYVPSMILLLPLILLLNRKQFMQITQGVAKPLYILGFILLGILLVPLVRSIILSPSNLTELIGLPVSLQPIELIKNIALVPVSIYVYGVSNPAYNLGNLPLLDIFSSTMATLGILYAVTRPELGSIKKIIWLAIPYIILVGCASSVATIALWPFVLIFVALGLHMLIAQWANVFPLNPIAKTTGSAVIIVTIGFASLYNLNRYFIAWRNAPATKDVYNIQNYQNLLQ